MDSDVLSTPLGHHIERGCESIHPQVALPDLTSWWHRHHGSSLHREQKCEHQQEDSHHCGYRQVTMTTTSEDNYHEDQDDIRGEDLPPHLNHPGTEDAEITPQFHRKRSELQNKKRGTSTNPILTAMAQVLPFLIFVSLVLEQKIGLRPVCSLQIDQTCQKIPSFKVKKTQKIDPKRAKNAFYGVLKSSSFPPKIGHNVLFVL